VRTAGEDWGEVVEEEQLPPLRSGLAMACGGAMVDWHWLPRRSGDRGFLRRFMGEPAADVAAVPVDVAAAMDVAAVAAAAADVAVLSTINGALLALARGGMGVACCCLVLLLQVLLLLLLLLLALRCLALQLLLLLWL